MADRNAPLPEYMRGRQRSHRNDVAISTGAGLASALAAVAAGEMPPAALGLGGLSAWNLRNAYRSADQYSDALRGEGMWENTGLPQAPGERAPPPPGMMRLGGPQPQQSDFDRAFAELDAALIDLDGDGVPDVRVPQQSVQQPSNAMAGFAQGGPVMTDAGMPIPKRLVPRGARPVQPGFEMLPEPQMPRPSNAMAQGRGSAQATVQFPIGMNGETETRPAPPEGGFQVPPTPPLNAMRNFAQRAYEDVVSDPMGAALGAIDFATGGSSAGVGTGPVGNAMSSMRSPTMRGVAVREAREFTRGGRAQNAREADQLRNWRRAEDIDVSQQPAHTLQARGTDGKFQPLDAETRAARQRGIEARRAEQQAREAAEARAAKDAEIRQGHRDYMQEHWGGHKLREEPSQEFLDTWKRPPKKPFPPY